MIKNYFSDFRISKKKKNLVNLPFSQTRADPISNPNIFAHHGSLNACLKKKLQNNCWYECQDHAFAVALEKLSSKKCQANSSRTSIKVVLSL